MKLSGNGSPRFGGRVALKIKGVYSTSLGSLAWHIQYTIYIYIYIHIYIYIYIFIYAYIIFTYVYRYTHIYVLYIYIYACTNVVPVLVCFLHSCTSIHSHCVSRLSWNVFVFFSKSFGVTPLPTCVCIDNLGSRSTRGHHRALASPCQGDPQEGGEGLSVVWLTKKTTKNPYIQFNLCSIF